MKINKVKCYQFCNHFLISLHAPKTIDPARLRYPVGKSAQGSKSKSHSWIFNKALAGIFKKLKAERKPVNMQIFPPPLQHLQPQSEALRTKSFVESLFGLFLGIQIKNMQISFRNEPEFSEITYELSCVKLQNVSCDFR